jgi:hypothetical protein
MYILSKLLIKNTFDPPVVTVYLKPANLKNKNHIYIRVTNFFLALR